MPRNECEENTKCTVACGLGITGFVVALLGAVTIGYKVGLWKVPNNCLICPEQYNWFPPRKMCVRYADGTFLYNEDGKFLSAKCPDGFTYVDSVYEMCFDFSNVTRPIGTKQCETDVVAAHNAEITFYVFLIALLCFCGAFCCLEISPSSESKPTARVAPEVVVEATIVEMVTPATTPVVVAHDEEAQRHNAKHVANQ